MGVEEIVLVGLALAFGFYMAWSIGANDVANAMGTSVGSGALTLKWAVIVAAILEFAGAFLVGSHVTETIRSEIIDVEMFRQTPEGWRLFVYGMLASLLAAAAWLQLASYFGWPVSTTHSIVGAIVGLGVVYGGFGAVDWGELLRVVSSWVVSPLMAGAISYLIFTLILRFIFYAPNPVNAAQRATPLLIFCVFFVMTLVTVFKGLANLGLDEIGLGAAMSIAGLVGLATSGAGFFLVTRWNHRQLPGMPTGSVTYRLRALQRAARHLRRVQLASDQPTAQRLEPVLREVNDLTEQTRREVAEAPAPGDEYRHVERIFVFLQILSACFVAFAHGANDVADAIGPLASVVETLRLEAVPIENAPVPPWALALGGAGIVVGLATWGWRVIQTIGRRITELTPSRGFAAEFGAATTIVIASRLGLPISTTHTLVGAVLGVGLARGIGALNLNTVRDIIASWLITLPAGASLSILFFYALAMIFG